MTKEELLAKLQTLMEGDTEENHLDADVALLEYINDPEITAVYREIPKWYA